MEDLIDLNSPSNYQFTNRNHKLDLNVPKLVFNSPNNANQTPECSFSKMETSFQRINDPNFDIGRESMPFSPQLCGRESLQLLDPRVFQDIDPGRESLGILPNIYSSSQDESPGPLNTAMLHPYSLLTRKGSAISSISSTQSDYNNMFNFSSLESTGPSRIFSLSSPFSTNKSEFNIAYLSSHFKDFKSKESVASIGNVLNENINSIDFLDIDRLRLQSCPVDSNKEINVEAERNCLSQTNRSKGSIGSRTSSVEEEDDGFNDSVFIEAHHLASKIADGSILDGSFEEGNMLDCTPQPMWNDESDIEEKPNIPVCDTETIFKKIDKMLPPTINVINPVTNLEQETEEKNLSNNSNSNSCNNSNDSNQPNLSAILNSGKKLNMSRVSSVNSNTSRSKDAKDILQNLSELINSGNISNEQKVAGQNLLVNLADILCNEQGTSKKEEASDSGHSSIEAEEPNVKPQFYNEVLDLSKKGCTSFSKETGDIEKNIIPQRLTHSFSFPSPKMPAPKLSNNLKMQAATMKNLINSMEGKCNVASENNESKNNCSTVSSSFSKLKPKKIEDSGNKRGPLKAIIPVNNMSRRDSNDSLKGKKRFETTPIKNHASTSKMKRTSTPINGPKLKPVAQSTPETNKTTPLACSSLLKKKKITCPLSPLARPNSFDMRTKNGSTDLNKSGSVPNISNASSGNESPLKTMNRRRSASDLKNTAGKLQQMRRTYSIGKENMLSSFRNGPLGSSDKLKNSEKDDSKLSLNNNSSRSSNIKPFNLMAKMRSLRKSGTTSK